MFSDPQKNIDQLGLLPGMQVADLGAGTGFYSLAAAQAVHDAGRVYAIDVQKDLLAKLKNTANSQRIHNIEVIWGDIEKLGGTKLRENSIDFAFAANIIFQLQDKKGFVTEVKRILKSGARILVVDWVDSFGGMGPASSAIVTKSSAQDLFLKEGFTFDKDITAGDHHYGLIFKKN
jgi:ubiquinone/menaquinone biosynthesis C-methylase UbiE